MERHTCLGKVQGHIYASSIRAHDPENIHVKYFPMMQH